jgi:hypothetical protein
VSPVDATSVHQAQQFRERAAPRDRAEAAPPIGRGRPAASPDRALGTLPALSARLGRLALAQRQHHQGWR